jgi:hypothetical protein
MSKTVSCQLNKRCSQKYGKLHTKLVTITPWEAVCVNLICLHMLNGKDGMECDFMCLTMIDPASSWFEIIELSVAELSPTSQSKIKAKTHDKTKEAYFDKSLSMICTLVNRTWFSRYPYCQHITYDNGVSLNSISRTYVTHMALSISQPVLKTLKRMLYWSKCIKS